MNAQQPPDPFTTLAALGYRPVPIIPPNAPISPKSNIYKRLQSGKDDPRGKVPGVRWPDGTWSGFDWLPYEGDARDFAKWRASGAGAGIKTGDGVLAIDADTLDAGCAAIIEDAVLTHFGQPPCRVGRAPKQLWVIGCSNPDAQYRRLDFGAKPDGSGPERVEILAGGRQFVAHGVHPQTKQPYRWPMRLQARRDLPVFTESMIDAFLADLAGRLPAAQPIVREGGGRSDVDQETLKGRLVDVRRCMECLPNDERFCTRESWLSVGYALKAALPDDGDAAFELFWEWSARWTGGTNDADVVEADWRRMKGPYRRGARWLYDLCDRIGRETRGAGNEPGETFTMASVWWEPPDLTPLPDPAKKIAAGIRAEPFRWIAPNLIPPRRSLYGGHYVRQFVSVTVAPSKVGKTALSIVEALSMASGRALLGVQSDGVARVWLWNGEDPIEETQRRVTAAMLLHGLTESDLGGRLFCGSGRNMPIMLAEQVGRGGAKIAEPVVEAVIAAIRAARIDVLVIDPFVSSHRVSENDNNAIDLVAKKWAYIADVTGCCVELVHHVRKLNGGDASVEDGRGASALIAASRSIRALARMPLNDTTRARYGEKVRRLFRFVDQSSNLFLPASDDEGAWFELASVELGNGGGEDALDGMLRGDSVGAVRLFDSASHDAEEIGKHTEDCEQEALRIIGSDDFKRSGKAGNWVGVAVAQAYHLDPGDAQDRAKIDAIVRDFVHRKLIRIVRKKDENRKMRPFVVVSNPPTGLFD